MEDNKWAAVCLRLQCECCRSSCSRRPEQSGCILFGMLECSCSPLGEGELHVRPAGKLSCEQLLSCETAACSTWSGCSKPHKCRSFIALLLCLFTVISWLQEQLHYVRARALTARVTRSWFWCRDGITGGSWMAVNGLWTVALWVGAHVLSSPQAALWYRPRGALRRGPTAPGGRAQNTVSAPDVFLRFGATTSKSDLIVFDCMIIQFCRLFLYFWGEQILSFNHTYLIAAIGATVIGPRLSSVMVMIMRLCLCWEGSLMRKSRMM